MNLAGLVAEPLVERVVGGGHGLERGLDVVSLDVHDDDVAVRRRLDEHGLSSDARTSPGALEGLAAFASPARDHGCAVDFGLAWQQRCHETNCLHVLFLSLTKGAGGQGVPSPAAETSLECVIRSPRAIFVASSARVATPSFWKMCRRCVSALALHPDL